MTISIWTLVRRVAPVAALCALVVSMDGSWATAEPAAAPAPAPAPASRVAPSAAPARPAGAAAGTAAAGAASLASGTPAAASDPGGARGAPRPARKQVAGKLNLNTATEEQLMLLPTVGPSKAERIVVWRKKNGGFKRVADLRRVKGFGYKTFKRLEPFLDIAGETTLVARR
jgi:competence ComEA-like helix-hairpin-helix protein